MEDIMQNDSAALNFGRFDVAVNWEEAHKSPLSLGAVPNQAKAFFPRIPLDSTTKQRSVFKGFFAFIAAALQAKQSAQVGGVEQTDELSISGVRWGRGVSQPRHTERDGHRVMSAASGLPVRAAGWTDFRHIAQRAEMQDRQRNLDRWQG